MDNLTMLEPGDKVEIFDDYFTIDSTRKIKGKIRINLYTKDPDIIEAYILFFSTEKSIFYITRVVDCIIKKKNIIYDGEIYQIIKEYYENDFNSSKNILRNKIYELIKNNCEHSPDNIVKIIEYENGKTIFFGHKQIMEEDVRINPTENFEKNIYNIPKKIKFKFKEKPWIKLK